METNASEIVANVIGAESSGTESTGEILTENEVTSSPPKKEGTDLARNLEMLARMEKKFRDEKAQWSEKRKVDDAESEKIKKALEFFEAFDKNPMEAIKMKGKSFEEFNRSLLDNADFEDPAVKGLNDVRAELTAAKKELQDLMDSKFTEKESAKLDEEREQVINQYRADTTNFLKENAETYELSSLNPETSVELIIEIAKEYYEAKGKILSQDEAAEMLEAHLVKQMEPMLRLKKVRSLIQGDDTDPFEAASQIASKTYKTIDDSYSATSSSTSKGQTEEQRMQEAIKVAQKLFGN